MRPPLLLIHGAFSHGAHLAPWVGHFGAAGYACQAPTLPGHGPSDPALLGRIGLSAYVEAMLAVRATLPEPPVLIGHSMGGLIAQEMAARTECAGLVLVASAPPFALPAQLRAIPHLLPLVPRIVAGRVLQPPPTTLEALALNGLPTDEGRDLVGTFGAESGRAYRSMILGVVGFSPAAVRCPTFCVSGSEDRIVSTAVAARTAATYRAEHEVLAGRGHWLIAASLLPTVAAPVLRWIDGLRS